MIPPNHALDSAITLWRAPRLVRVMRSMRLPEGLTFLLRILSGERQALVEAERMTRLDERRHNFDRRVLCFAGYAVSRRVVSPHTRGRARRGTKPNSAAHGLFDELVASG